MHTPYVSIYLKETVNLTSLANLVDDLGVVGAVKVLKINERDGVSGGGFDCGEVRAVGEWANVV